MGNQLVSEHKGLQENIRERFFKYARSVPSDIALVEEETAPSAPEEDWGELLLLRLIPSDKERCRLLIYVGERYCMVYLGNHAEFEFNPHFERDVSNYPDDVEKLIRAAIYGAVSETEWLRKGMIICSVTNVKVDSDLFHSGTLSGCLFVPILALIRIVEKQERVYKPYLDDKV